MKLMGESCACPLRSACCKKLSQARQERDILKAALRKYGQHHWKCAALAQPIKIGEWCCAEPKKAKEIVKEIVSLPSDLPCSCGLTASLGKQDETGNS